MAEEFNTQLPLNTNNDNKDNVPPPETEYLTSVEAAFITNAVRNTISETLQLPEAPSSKLVEASILLADISGFTKLGERLIAEHGEAKGAEEFATQVSNVISELANYVHRYQGEIVKFAGDMLLCMF